MMRDTIAIPDHLQSRLERLAADHNQDPARFAASLLGTAVEMMEQQEGEELRAMVARPKLHVPLERDPTADNAKSALCILDATNDMAQAALGNFLDGAQTRPSILPGMILPLLDAVSDLDLARRDGDTENAAAVTRRLLDIWNGTF